MIKKFNKAFSLIEVLFVLALMSALAAIAIPTYLSDKESVILTKLRMDTTNALNTMNNVYEVTNSFEAIYGTGFTSSAGNNGETETATTNGTKFSLTKGNSIKIINSSFVPETCPEGFVLTISNNEIKKQTYFDSCQDSKFKIISIGS